MLVLLSLKRQSLWIVLKVDCVLILNWQRCNWERNKKKLWLSFKVVLWSSALIIRNIHSHMIIVFCKIWHIQSMKFRVVEWIICNTLKWLGHQENGRKWDDRECVSVINGMDVCGRPQWDGKTEHWNEREKSERKRKGPESVAGNARMEWMETSTVVIPMGKFLGRGGTCSSSSSN